MTVIINIDEEDNLSRLDKWRKRAKIGAYSGDITDDGKTIMVHFDYTETVYLDLTELLIAYMEKHGIL